MRTRSRTRVGAFRSKFVVEERYLPVEARRGFYRMSGVLIAAGLVAFLILLVGVLTHTGFERLDTPVEHWFDSLRTGDVTGFMIVLAMVFGPVGMPIIVLIVTVVWLLLAKHAWRPILLACGMVAGVILAQVLAPIVKHPRPPIGLMFAGPDHSYSFPSATSWERRTSLSSSRSFSQVESNAAASPSAPSPSRFS